MCVPGSNFLDLKVHEKTIVFVSRTYFDENTSHIMLGERGGSVVECRTPEREVRGSRPTAAVLCPWARHFTPRKYWLITQEAMAPSRHDWKIVDWDVKPQHTTTHYAYYASNDFCLPHTRFESSIGLWKLPKWQIKPSDSSICMHKRTSL